MDKVGRLLSKDYVKKLNQFKDSNTIISVKVTLNDTKELITEKELKKILEKAHPLIYGDELVNFLTQLIEVIRTHTHPFAMDPPCFTTPQTKVLDTDLDNITPSFTVNTT